MPHQLQQQEQQQQQQQPLPHEGGQQQAGDGDSVGESQGPGGLVLLHIIWYSRTGTRAHMAETLAHT